MKEIDKENDIFVSTLLNPTSTTEDLLANGINGANTGFLDQDTYKQSKFVKQAFEENGVFNNDAFSKAYELARQKYSDLTEVQSYEDLNHLAKYNENDIYAPLNSNQQDKTYSMEKVRNPLHVSTGVTSLFGKGESDKSARELAQSHKIWDPKNEKWLDETPEDLGLKYIYKPSLVYATWDEDGTHFDASLGREIKHSKGEWKTDENGEYYTELAGNKQQYGKEFVALSDVLTKEDSWANKIDFFDSDDKHKSIGGQLMKTAATIAPYMIPGVNLAWGGITAAVSMGTVLPTFAKMLEGIAIGDKETSFTKAMSAQENWFNKFSKSHSDEAQKSIINAETILETVGDVFGQLYQMRAAASLSKLFANSMTKAEKQASQKFAEKFGAEFAKASKTKGFTENVDQWKTLYNELLQATPEMKAIVDRTSKLSKSLSLGYMAMTSSADVYSDAIQGGYDRRMAGLAGIMATAGQYGLMMNNRMGDWFLDATVGYKEGVSRNVMRQALRPYYDKIAETSAKLGTSITADEKVGLLSKLYNNIFKSGGRKLIDLIKYGGESIWQRAAIEGVEEVTEEAVMDATKGMFDFMSYMGIGKNANTASFGGWDNVFSSEGAQRYLMNFLGGVIGGALFDVQGRYIEPRINALISGKALPEVRYSIIDEVMKGHTQDLLDEAARMALTNKTPIHLADGQVMQKTQGEAIRDALQNYIKFVDGVITENNFKVDNIMSDDMIKKVIRTKALQPLVESSGVMDMITGDYTKMVDEFVKLQAEYNSKYNPDKENKEEKKDEKKEEKKEEKSAKEDNVQEDSDKEKLERKLSEKRQQIVDFLSGKNEADYVRTALIYLHPDLRKAALGVDKYIFTKGKYGVDYSTLQETGAGLSKASIDAEYKKWRESSDTLDTFREIGVKGFDEAEMGFSSIFKKYADSDYANVRTRAIVQVLAASNFNLGALVQNPNIRQQLIEWSRQLSDAQLPGITLEDKLQLGDSAKKLLVSKLTNINQAFISDTVKKLNAEIDRQKTSLTPEEQAQVQYYTEDSFKEIFEQALFQELEHIPIENLTKQIIDNALVIASSNVAQILVGDVIKNTQGDAQAVKAAVDAKLKSLGFNPIVDYTFTGNVAQDASLYTAVIIAPKFHESSFEIGSSVLEAYVDNNEVLDNEIVRKINRAFYDSVLQEYPKLWKIVETALTDALDELTIDEWQRIYRDNQPLFKKALREGIDTKASIDDIVTTWLFGENGLINPESPEFKAFENTHSDYQKKVITSVVDDIKKLPEYALFEKVQTKQQEENPLYKALREIGMKVFDGDEMKLFDFLENESKALSQVSDIGEYIRQGFTKEAIDNFITKLQFLQALALGMEDSGIDPDHQIAYNVQMKLWDQKWNEGKNADKYATIKTEQVIAIQNDLELLINKLQFIKTLIEFNVESKQKENLKTEANFHDLLLDKIDHVEQFAIGGVTIMPEDSELAKFETAAEKVAFIEHTLYTKVQELLKHGQKIDELVSEIYGKFGINRETIHNTNLTSAQLNPDTKALTEYDIFTWLTTILGSDSHEFFYKYKNLLSADSYKLVPFFTQEYATKVLYSFANDKTGIHDAAFKWLYSQDTSRSVQKTANMAFVNGIAGAGKTAAVMATVKVMLEEDNIITAAPNQNQATKLSRSLQSISDTETNYRAFDKRKLLEEFITQEGLTALDEAVADKNLEKTSLVKKESVEGGGSKTVVNVDQKYIKTVKNAPKYVFIDEVTHFNIAELSMLDAAAKKNGFKIIAAGDTLQKGNNTWNSHNIQDVFAWKTPTLTISSRAANIHQKDNVTSLQSVLRQIEQITSEKGFNENDPSIQALLSMGKKLSYYQTDKQLHGAKIVNEITSDDLKILKAASAGKSLMIIAELDNNGEIADAEFLSKLHDAGISEYQVYSPDDYSPHAVQGAEADYVIVKDLPNLENSKISNLVTFYTYLSRALEGSLIFDISWQYSENLNLLNELAAYTSGYELPGLAQQSKIKGEKIEQIIKTIGDFSPEVVEEHPEKKKVKSVKATKSTNISSEEETVTAEDAKELLTLTEEAEQNMERKPQPIDTTPREIIDGIRSYSYYNRLGLGKDSATTNSGSHLDLDGILGKAGQRVPTNIKVGYKKLKNFLVTSDYESLYSDDGSMSITFTEALYDNDIVDLLYALYPHVAENITNVEDIRNTVRDALDSGELKVELGEEWYITVKKYDESTDKSDSLAASALTTKSGALIANFGKQIQITHNNEVVVNQLMTFGSLSQMDTITNTNTKVSKQIKCNGYAKLLTDATQKLKTKDVVIYEVDAPTMGKDLVVYNTNNGESFVSLSDMVERQGIKFSTNEEGTPNVYLINNEKSTVNEVETFSFLHMLAGTSIYNTQEDYKKRIEQLEKSFVSNGKLTVSGYYFAVGSYGPMSRVLILQPSSYSFKDALERQHSILHSKTAPAQGTRLSLQAESMSQSSQLRLFRAVFEGLGAVDANGLVVPGTEGLKPYVQKIAADLVKSSTETKWLADLPTWIESEIDIWGDKDFDIDFLSHLMRGGTPDKNGKVSGYGRYVGPLLINDLISINNNGTITAKQLLQEGQTRRTSVDINFDLSQRSYREFQAAAEEQKDSFELSDEVTYTPIKIRMAADDIHFIGLYNTYLQPPYFYFNDDSLGNANVADVDFTTAEWERPDITWEAAREKKEKSSKTPTTATIQEMRDAKTYNPKTDRNPVQVIFPSKRGKFKDAEGNSINIDPHSKFYNIRTFTDKELQNWENETYHVKAEKGRLFDLRLYDTVQIFGDDTHTYKLSYAVTNGNGFVIGYKFSHKDGKEVTSNDIIYVKEISAVVHRDIPKDDYGWKYIAYGIEGKGRDYYATSEYEYRRQDYRKRQTGKAALIWNVDESEQALERAFSENNVKYLLVYAVHDTDESVISPITEAAETLDDGVDLTDTGIHLCNTVEEAKNIISTISEEDNLNGIAVIGVYGTGEGYVQFMQNRKAFLQKIVNNGEGYIKAYISDSKKPKFTQKTAKAEARKRIGEKQSDAETLRIHLEQIDKAIADKNNFDKMMNDLRQVQYDTFADAKKHFAKDTIIYRYQNSEGRVVYSVFPKRLITKKQVDFRPSLFDVNDNIYVLKEDDGTYYSATVTGKDNDGNVTITYEINGTTQTTQVLAQKFGLLYGIKYLTPETVQELLTKENAQAKPDPSKKKQASSQVRRKSATESEQATKIKALIEEANKLDDFYQRIEKVKENYYASFAEAKKDFKNNYIIFPHAVNGEIKYSVFPKEFITDFKDVETPFTWNIGDSFKILYQRTDKNGEFYSATITDITDNNVKYNYTINGRTVSKEVPKNNFNLLTDILYFKEAEPKPKQPSLVEQSRLLHLPTNVITALREQNVAEQTLKIYDNVYKELTQYLESIGQNFDDSTTIDDIVYYIQEIHNRQVVDSGLQIADMFKQDEDGNIYLIECK